MTRAIIILASIICAAHACGAQDVSTFLASKIKDPKARLLEFALIPQDQLSQLQAPSGRLYYGEEKLFEDLVRFNAQFIAFRASDGSFSVAKSGLLTIPFVLVPQGSDSFNPILVASRHYFGVFVENEQMYANASTATQSLFDKEFVLTLGEQGSRRGLTLCLVDNAAHPGDAILRLTQDEASDIRTLNDSYKAGIDLPQPQSALGERVILKLLEK